MWAASPAAEAMRQLASAFGTSSPRLLATGFPCTHFFISLPQSRDFMGGDEAFPGGHGMDFPCSVTEAGQVHCPSGN